MKKNGFLPWLMMLLLFEFLFFMMPGLNSTVNLFVVPVSNELGLSRSAYSLSFAVSAAAMVTISFLYGKLYNKFGARFILLFTGFFALAGCVISAFANGLTVVYIGALFRGVALGLGSTAIVANVLFNWFHKSSGLAMGIVFSAVGFGGAALMPVFTYWVASNSVGWRLTYIYIGLIVFIASVIAAYFIKGTPEEVGTVPLGYSDNTSSNASESRKVFNPDFNSVLKSPAFIAAAGIVFLVNFALYSVYVHLEAYLNMNHCELKTIAAALSILALGVGAAKLIYGFVSDHFGMRVAAFMAGLFHTASILILLIAKSDLVFIIACILLGVGIGALQLSVSLFAGLFGKNNYAMIVGIFSAELGLAWGIGPWLTGLFYDIYGNYNGIFVLFLFFGILIGLLGFLLPKKEQSAVNSI